MNTEPTKATGGVVVPRDTENWAKPIDHLRVSPSATASSLNVAGRQVVGPLQGFGQMWQKTYRVRLSGAKVSPADVIAVWKARFPEFWPPGNHFYGPLTGIAPGEIGLINVNVGGGMRLSTGVMVIYADAESFTFMTPEGHMFAGWINFSTTEEDSATVVQVQALIRANDPIYEMGFRAGFGHRSEDAFWHQTLESLARHIGVARPSVQQQVTCVDPRMQWAKIGNVRHNAAIRATLYRTTARPLARRLVQT